MPGVVLLRGVNPWSKLGFALFGPGFGLRDGLLRAEGLHGAGLLDFGFNGLGLGVGAVGEGDGRLDWLLPLSGRGDGEAGAAGACGRESLLPQSSGSFTTHMNCKRVRPPVALANPLMGPRKLTSLLAVNVCVMVLLVERSTARVRPWFVWKLRYSVHLYAKSQT